MTTKWYCSKYPKISLVLLSLYLFPTLSYLEGGWDLGYSMQDKFKTQCEQNYKTKVFITFFYTYTFCFIKMYNYSLERLRRFKKFLMIIYLK